MNTSCISKVRMFFLATAAIAAGFAFSSACDGGDGAATLVSIAVTPAAASIAAGATQQFAATGTYSDSTTADVTATVTWASSDTAVAAFETPDADHGLATARSAGTSTISATDAATGISSTTSGGDAAMTVAAISGTIKALYPTNGGSWNDYVKNDGADIYKATDTACDAAADGPGYRACLNGGIMRTVTVTGRDVCDGLTAEDSLGVFTWVCDSTTNDVRMVSVGFKDGKKLSDLIDFTATPPRWQTMNATVSRDGNAYLATDVTNWWDNTIIEDNDGNDGTAMNEGEVYVITANPNADYTIGANKVALVVKPGILLHGDAGGDDVIAAINRDFLWIEGDIDATGDNDGTDLEDVRFSSLMHVRVSNAASAGLYLKTFSKNVLKDIVVSNTNQSGIQTWTLSNNLFRNLMAVNNSSEGLYHENSDNNIFINLISMNTNTGLYMGSVLNDIYREISTTNASSDGININGNYCLIVNGVAANYNIGLNASPLNDSTIDGLAAAHGSLYGINLSNVCNRNRFTGIVKVGNNTTKDCNVTGGADPGLTAACAPQGSSDFTLTTGATLAASFIGKATSDSVNTDGPNGTALLAEINDWLNFENAFRGWGKDGSAFPNNDNRDMCAGGTCRIWDWSLAAADAVLREVLTLPTGDDTLTHTWSDASTVTFLRNAAEIFDDGVGNDNGLCESNETCLFTPNIGSYQGHGNLVSAGDFVDGAITGVTLLRYEINGR